VPRNRPEKSLAAFKINPDMIQSKTQRKEKETFSHQKNATGESIQA